MVDERRRPLCRDLNSAYDVLHDLLSVTLHYGGRHNQIDTTSKFLVVEAPSFSGMYVAWLKARERAIARGVSFVKD